VSIIDRVMTILFQIHFKEIKHINNLKLIFILTDVQNIIYIKLFIYEYLSKEKKY
jgi:hypothetical protein